MKLDKANWIGTPGDYGDICPEFGKRFSVEGSAAQAVLTITAIGVYEAHLNGNRVGALFLRRAARFIGSGCRCRPTM